MAKNPEIYVLLVDETEYWADDIVKEAGRLIGVYLYDKMEITHLCELAGSYCCWHVETATDKHVSDDTWEDIFCAEKESADYYHTNTIDKCPDIGENYPLPADMKMAKFLLWKLSDDEWEEAQEEDSPRQAVMEAALEYARCNSVY